MQLTPYSAYPYWVTCEMFSRTTVISFKFLARVIVVSGFLGWNLCRLRMVRHLSLPSSLRTFCLIVSDTCWLLSMVFLLLSSLYLSPMPSNSETFVFYSPLTAFCAYFDVIYGSNSGRRQLSFDLSFVSTRTFYFNYLYALFLLLLWP